MNKRIRLHDSKGRKMHDFLHWLRKTIRNDMPMTPEAYERIHNTVISEGIHHVRKTMSLEINKIRLEE